MKSGQIVTCKTVIRFYFILGEYFILGGLPSAYQMHEGI